MRRQATGGRRSRGSALVHSCCASDRAISLHPPTRAQLETQLPEPHLCSPAFGHGSASAAHESPPFALPSSPRFCFSPSYFSLVDLNACDAATTSPNPAARSHLGARRWLIREAVRDRGRGATEGSTRECTSGVRSEIGLWSEGINLMHHRPRTLPFHRRRPSVDSLPCIQILVLASEPSATITGCRPRTVDISLFTSC